MCCGCGCLYRIMFPSCLANIYEYHRLFLRQLESRLADEILPVIIGDLFESFLTSSNVSSEHPTTGKTFNIFIATL